MCDIVIYKEIYLVFVPRPGTELLKILGISSARGATMLFFVMLMRRLLESPEVT